MIILKRIGNRAFTLVELLAVIALLALVGLIVMPNIFSAIASSNVKKYESVELELKNTLQMYNVDKQEDIWTTNNTYRPTLSDLKDVNENLDTLDCTVSLLEIDRSTGGYQYKVCISCGDDYKSDDAYCNW